MTEDFKPKLEKVKSGETAVNQPFEFGNYQVFQEQYAADPEFKTMSFNIENQKTGKVVDTIKVDLRNPQETYKLKNGYDVELKDFLPDFVVKDGKPTTNSSRPVNPAFVFTIKSPEHPKGERSLIGIKLNVGGDENQYKMGFAGTELSNISGVRIKKDLTLPFLFAGGMIFMVGLLLGMYWPHRRLWLKERNGQINIAGFTNKNALGLQKEVNLALTEVGLPQLEDRQKLREEGK
ncbi:cytochrome c biogenesis protein ResB [Exiguobacterium artemiae]